MTLRSSLRMALDFFACALIAFLPFYVFVEVSR